MAAQAAAGPPPMTRTSAVSSRPPLPATALRVRTRISGPRLAVSTPGGPEVLETQPVQRAVEITPVDPGAEVDRPGRSGERQVSLRTGAVLVGWRSVAWRMPVAQADRPFLLDHFSALEDP